MIIGEAAGRLHPSAVAGVLDSSGGFRVVVTQPSLLHHHVGVEERLFIVPDLLVWEPVPWDRIPWVIRRAADHTNAELARAGSNRRVSAG